MKRRVNLYRATKKAPAFDKNSLAGNVVIVLAVIGFVLATGLGIYFLDQGNQTDLANLKTEKRNIEAQIQQLQQQFTQKRVSADLQAEIKRITNQIDARKNLMNLLDQIDPEQAFSFSAYMLALAESSRPESWLNKFVINTSEGFLQLGGGASNGPAVSTLLEGIATTAPFDNMAVTRLEVGSRGTGVEFQAEAELNVNE